MIRALAVGLTLLALSACSSLQRVAQFTAADTASAAAIATAAGMPGDAQCWADFNAVAAAVEGQLAASAGGAASTVALQRANKTVATRPECAGILVELVTALSKIPYGPTALMVLGF